MIKRFYLLLTALSLLAVSPIKAQSKEEKMSSETNGISYLCRETAMG